MYVGNTVTTEHEEIHKGDRVHPKHGRATENKENYEGDKVHHKYGRTTEHIKIYEGDYRRKLRNA